jgi:hypothetical protein
LGEAQGLLGRQKQPNQGRIKIKSNRSSLSVM